MTNVGALNAGSRFTASEARGIAPLTARRTSNGTAMVNNTLANEPVLFLPVAANTVWFFDMQLTYNGAATGTGDLKFMFTIPSGATMNGTALTVTNPLGVALLPYTQSTTSIFSASNGTGSPLGIRVWGTLIVSGTPGNLQLQAAEQTTNATGTTIMTGSTLLAWQTG